MKINNTLKTLPLLLGSMLCFNANAGVVATSYLEINSLFVEIDTDGDGVPDVAPADIQSYIKILAGTRESNTLVNFNGISDGNASVAGPIGTANADLVCTGPSCGGLGLTDNGQSLDLGNLVHDHSKDYSTADSNVTGNALGAGATGFTYADVGISKPNALAAASGSIFNNLLTTLTILVAGDLDIQIRFTAVYDAFVDAIITPDITADGSVKATASAEASFNTKLIGLTGGTLGTVLDDGLSFSDLAFDVPGLGDIKSISENDKSYTGAWSTLLTAGTYQAEIVQDSDVQASLIPEPSSIALLGLSILGLAAARRRKV